MLYWHHLSSLGISSSLLLWGTLEQIPTGLSLGALSLLFWILLGSPGALWGSQEAPKTNLPRQVFAPKPRSLGKPATEGHKDRLQLDLIDFTMNTKKNNPRSLPLVGIDVFTCDMAGVPLKT